MPLLEAAKVLNDVDWHSLGFVVDGRFIFSQRSLENCPLPKETYNTLRELLAQK
jgi:adenine-specific DNA-methyltransferase